jgi:hypothetical protein
MDEYQRGLLFANIYQDFIFAKLSRPLFPSPCFASDDFFFVLTSYIRAEGFHFTKVQVNYTVDNTLQLYTKSYIPSLFVSRQTLSLTKCLHRPFLSTRIRLTLLKYLQDWLRMSIHKVFLFDTIHPAEGFHFATSSS